jgi:Tol biopolymer transport system component
MAATVAVSRFVSARLFGATWLVFGVSLVAALGCGGSIAGTRRHPGTIAFTVNRSGWGEIWVMDPDGSDRMRLTALARPQTDASGNTSPAWSPDGRFIAFASSGEAIREDQRDVEIYTMRADGSERRRLTNDHVLDGTPAWSPDGKRIAFAHIPGAGTETVSPRGVIEVITANGRQRTQLTRHPDTGGIVMDSQPAWSPDGRLIAFTRTTFGNSQARSGVYAIEPSGRGEHLLIKGATDPAWSPNGRSIAFTSIRNRNGKTCFQDCEIYVARSDGTGLRRLTRDQAADGFPAWAPDSRRIAFVSDRSDRVGHAFEIYVMAADGTGVRRLTTNNVWDLEPDWR